MVWSLPRLPHRIRLFELSFVRGPAIESGSVILSHSANPFPCFECHSRDRVGGRSADYAQGRQHAPLDGAPMVGPDDAGGDVVFLHSRNQPLGAVQSDPPAQSLDADFDRADGLLCPRWQHYKTQTIRHNFLLVGADPDRIFYPAA